MKTASFTWKAKRSTIYGTVTLKDNGKVSVSMPGANKYNSSPAERYQAKQLALAIVAADFKHEAVNSFTEENTTGLINRLKEETKQLLEVYIERTKEYAKISYNWAFERMAWSYAKYIEEYGTRDLGYKTRDEMGNVTDKALSEYGMKQRSEVSYITSRTLDTYEKEQIDAAKRHYNESIEKLALKLNRKGIKDDTEMKMVSTRVGINLETIIYHEGTSTRAWTIFAAQDSVLVAPHYRYLVK